MAVIPIVFHELKRAVLDLISDVAVEADIYDDLHGVQTNSLTLKNGVVAAISASCTRVWKQAIIDIPEGSTSLALPSDLIEVEGVRDGNTNKFIPRVPVKVNQIFERGWITYPNGFVTFTTALEKGGKLYYSALWNVPSEDVYGNIDDFEFDFPFSLYTPIMYYTAHFALLTRASQGAVIRQYNTKVDSGDPLDNPLLQVAQKLHQQFEIELKRIPETQKGVTY